jgi:hypothetical protein
MPNNCAELIRMLDDAIKDEDKADDEYTDLMQKIMQVKPTSGVRYSQVVDKIREDEFRHKITLIGIRDELKKICSP